MKNQTVTKEELREIRNLLNRYLDGETTNAEEVRLAEYLERDNVAWPGGTMPEDLLPFREMFRMVSQPTSHEDAPARSATQGYACQSKKSTNKPNLSLWIGSALAIAASVALMFMLAKPDAEPQTEPLAIVDDDAVETLDSAKVVAPSIESPQDSSLQEKIKNLEIVPNARALGSGKTMRLAGNSNTKDTTNDQLLAMNECKVFDCVEQMPCFPGGDSALMEFLRNNTVYPTDAENAQIQGRVVATFVVEKDGTVTNPKVIRSVHPSLDAEALRIISMMPRWTPGKIQDKFVRVKYTVPIIFRLLPEDDADTPVMPPMAPRIDPNQAYDLNGHPVDESYRGMVVKGGKKYYQK